MPLPASTLPKLAKLIPLLSSDKTGEVIATVAAIDRTLKRSGANWHDLTSALTRPPPVTVRRPPRRPPPGPGRATHGDLLAMASELDGNPDLSPWEMDFVANMRRILRQGHPPSKKQRSILERIWERVGEGAE